MRKTAAAVLVLFLAVSPVWGTVYYVATGGNDGAAGTTTGAPWRTLSYGSGRLVAGDTMVVRGGTYVGADGEMRFPNDGVAGSPITVCNYPGEGVIIDCDSYGVVEHNGEYYGVYEGGNYLAFEGLTVLRPPVGDVGGFNLWDSDYTRIEYCVVSNGLSNQPSNFVVGIWNRYSEGMIVRNCRFADLQPAADNAYAGAICTYDTTDFLFENNEVYDMYCAYLDKSHPENSIVRNNYFHDVDVGYKGNIHPDQMGTTSVYENVVWDCSQYGIWGGNFDNIWIWNNTVSLASGAVYDPAQVMHLNNPDFGHTHRIWNNILVVPDEHNCLHYSSAYDGWSGDGSGYYIDYNNYYRPNGSGDTVAMDVVGGRQWTLADWQASPAASPYGWDTSSISAAPQFVTGAPTRPEDFRLAAGTPGTHVGTDYLGKSPGYDFGAPDMGAFPRGDETIVGIIPRGTPQIGINAPTTAESYNTSAMTVTVGGTASDDNGVTQVTWTNETTGDSGVASGTESWTVTDIPLAAGAGNLVRVRAYDAEANVGSDTLAVIQGDPPATDTNPPYVTQQSPAPDAADVPRNAQVSFHVRDDGDGVDQATISLTVNGGGVTAVVTGTAADFTVTYSPGTLFAADSTVSVSVTASDLAGNAMAEVDWSFTTSSTTVPPPGPPSGLTILMISMDSVLLSFTASPSAHTTGYKLYYRNGTVGYESVDIGNVTQYMLAGLSQGSTYHVMVKAYDAAGQESGGTPEIVVTTLGGTTHPGGDVVEEMQVRPNARELDDLGSVRLVGPPALVDAEVVVYGVSGAMVGTIRMADAGGNAQASLDGLGGLVAGVYVFVAEENGTAYRARLVVRP